MTIQQHASFDAEAAGLNATSNTNPAVSKMVKLWESKNAKRAVKASGATLMALSLSACGGSDDVAVVTPVTPVTPVAPTPVAMTADADTLVGTSGDDAFTGGSADIDATDAIVDTNDDDNDTLTLTGTEFATSIDTSGGMTVRGIENVIVNFDSLTASTFDATGIDSAAAITVNQVREGSGADITVSNVITGSTVTAGADINSLTVTTDAGATVEVTSATADTLVSATVTDSATANGMVTVNAAAAATATAVAAKGTATIDAAAATTINATGTTMVVTGGAEDSTINLTGVGTDTATVNVANDLTVNTANAVETVNVNASAASVVTFTGNAATKINLTGDVTLSGDEALFDGKAVVDAGEGSTTLKLTTIGASDLSKVAVDNINIAGATAGGIVVKVNDNANVEVSKDTTGGTLTIDADDDVTDAATTYLKGMLNLTLSENVDANAIIIDNSGASDDGFDTVNLSVTKAQTGLVLTAGSADVVATGAKSVVFGTSTAKSLDASGMSGAVTIATSGNMDDVKTGSGNDTVTLGTTADLAVDTGAGNDTLKLAGTLDADAVIAGGAGTDTLELTNAANIAAASVSGVEYFTLATNALTLDDAQASGATLVFSGTNAAATDDLINVVDIDNATADFSNIDGTLVDGLTFNATGSAYDTVSTTSGLVGIANVAAGLDATALGTSVAMNVTGSKFDDIIVTGAGADVISSGDGADEVSTGGGADTVFGGKGADYITTGDAADAITGGEGADTVVGGAGADVISLIETTAATDVVNIATGTDSLEGTSTVAGYDSITGFAATATANDKLLIADAAITSAARTVADATGSTTETDTGTVTSAMSAAGVVTVDGTSKGNVDTLSEWIDVTEALIQVELLAVDVQNTTVTAAFEFDGNTYVVQGTDTSVTGGSAITYAQDAVVELVGLTDVVGLNGTAALNVIEII